MKLPDWLIYGAVIGGLLLIAVALRGTNDAPRSAVTAAEIEGALLGPVTPFDPSVTVEAPDETFQPTAGTAFSVDRTGLWITARHVVEGCAQPALIIGGGRAVSASTRLATQADIAVLITDGGPPALELETRPMRLGERAFHPGFPQGQPGEASSRLLGRETLRIRGRGERDEPVLVWAEVGRTAGLEGTLAGLSGAPALDSQGRVMGVTIAESPRRGRIYTTAPETFGPAVNDLATSPAEPLAGEITLDNYGRAANALRRDLRVAQVVCLAA